MTTPNRMWGIGCNANMQLGFGSADKWELKPAEIILQEVKLIAAGFRQSYIVMRNQLRGCGESKKYQLGKISKKPSLWHVLVEQLETLKGQIVKLACGKRFLLMLTNHHEIYAYGYNEQNCLNSKQTTFFAQPTLVFKDVRHFVCGWAHVTLLKLDGTIESYGKSNLGQLGHQKNTNKVYIPLEHGESISNIASGTEFTFAVTSKQRLYGWGWNEHFNILPSENQVISEPTFIPTPQKCIKVWTNPALTLIQTQL